jgi:hypothetical protein
MSPLVARGALSARVLLRWQFRLAHELLDATIEHATTEALHRCPPGTAAPAGACYAQGVLCEDLSVNGVLAAGRPLALSTWVGRTGLSEIPPLAGPTDWRAWARRMRLDQAKLRPYAKAVYASTDAYIAALPDEALECSTPPVGVEGAKLVDTWGGPARLRKKLGICLRLRPLRSTNR